jgi:hypothetical protein
MTLKSKIYFTLFIILQFVGLFLLLGLLAVKSLPASDHGKPSSTQRSGAPFDLPQSLR